MNIKQILFLIILIGSIDHLMASLTPTQNTLSRPTGYWTAEKPNPFTSTTIPESQREDWYQHSDKIAETFATISNIGFVGAAAVAYKNNAPLSAGALILAGTASAVSHAIPYQSLNTVDKIFAAASVLAVGYDSKLHTLAGFTKALSNPTTLFSLVSTGVIYALDTYISRSKEFAKVIPFITLPIIKRKSEHKWVHTLWHIAAAITASTLLSNR